MPLSRWSQSGACVCLQLPCKITFQNVSARETRESPRLRFNHILHQNFVDPSELVYTLANFACQGVLGSLQDFRRNFERPIAAGNCKNATQEKKRHALSQSEALDQITRTFMLRRLQKDVLTQLLPQRTEALVFCRPSQEQQRLYGNIAQIPLGGGAVDILTTLTDLRKLCFHPLLCQHQDGFGGTCDLKASGKLQVLHALLLAIRESAPHEKVVVVSNFTSVLSAIELTLLKPNNLSFVRLDGTTDAKVRQNVVDSFNKSSSDRSFCFLLSAKAGGW